MKINICIKDTRWSRYDLKELCYKSLKLALSTLATKEKYFEISVLACDNSIIKDLNMRFRQKNIPTNILSWPETSVNNLKEDILQQSPTGGSCKKENPIFLGNIAISFDQCLSESNLKKISFRNHITHLLLHGCLHLLGYSHEEELEAKVMETTEIKLLESIGIKNPYYFFQ